MHRLMMLAFFFAAFLLQTLPAVACGGYFPDAIEDIGEVWVSATVLEVDDKGYNAILEVDRYFKGRGGKYLTVYRLPPALQHAGHIRNYDTGCLYAGGGYIWQAGSYGYFALKPRDNGTFDDYGMLTSGSGAGSGHYIPQDGMVEFFSENEPYDIKLPVAEFESLLLEIGGRRRALRPRSNTYPLMRFLHIKTESGARYRLNPDRSVTSLDPQTTPIAISPDGSHVMFRFEPGQLEFQYLWLTRRANGGLAGRDSVAHSSAGSGDRGNTTLPGDFALFSPDSNFVAIQEESRLAVNLFHSRPLEGAIVGYGRVMAMREIARIDVHWRSTVARQPLFWSADSKSIAYQDTRGIWLLRILEAAEPQLILPAADGQELLEVSASGRYLRYGGKLSWTLLDVETGETWKNSLITPDESRLIHFLSEGSDDYLEQLSQLRQACRVSELLCPMVLTHSVHTGTGSEDLPQYFYWQEPDFLGLVYRDAIQSIRWSFSLQHTHCHLASCLGVKKLPPINAVAYDPLYEQPAIAFDETKIGFKLHAYDGFVDSVDLSEYLDGPIVELEWGQPIFYVGN